MVMDDKQAQNISSLVQVRSLDLNSRVRRLATPPTPLLTFVRSNRPADSPSKAILGPLSACPHIKMRTLSYLG